MPEAIVSIGVHPSQFPGRLHAELIESLRIRRISPKFHYETRRQARAWLRLHETYSPALRDDDCQNTYLRAFDDLAQRLGSGHIQIIALGCGRADKECRFIERLPNARDRVSFVAIDVSAPLALMARAQAAQQLPSDRCNALLCDLAAADDLAGHLSDLSPPGGQRLLTCFGLLPNFRPNRILPRLAALLHPGDHFLLSANLAPGPDYHAALHAIRPQYDNALTREWLGLLLNDIGIEPGDGHMQFMIEPDPAWDPLARIAAHFEFDRPRCVVIDNDEFRFARGDRLEVFFSYRHTPASIRGLLAAHAIQLETEWIIASGEEGIFSSRRGDSW